MRIIPTVPVRCHVCGSRFAQRNRLVQVRPRPIVRTEPEQCPRCDAPILHVPPLDEGLARGLVLTEAGTAAERRELGTTGRYLRRYTRTEREVDELLALVERIDYDAWLADAALRDQRLGRTARPPSRRLPKLAALAKSGALVTRLGRVAARVKRDYRTRDRRHLAIFARRRGPRRTSRAA